MDSESAYPEQAGYNAWQRDRYRRRRPGTKSALLQSVAW